MPSLSACRPLGIPRFVTPACRTVRKATERPRRDRGKQKRRLAPRAERQQPTAGPMVTVNPAPNPQPKILRNDGQPATERTAVSPRRAVHRRRQPGQRRGPSTSRQTPGTHGASCGRQAALRDGSRTHQRECFPPPRSRPRRRDAHESPRDLPGERPRLDYRAKRAVSFGSTTRKPLKRPDRDNEDLPEPFGPATM